MNVHTCFHEKEKMGQEDKNPFLFLTSRKTSGLARTDGRLGGPGSADPELTRNKIFPEIAEPGNRVCDNSVGGRAWCDGNDGDFDRSNVNSAPSYQPVTYLSRT